MATRDASDGGGVTAALSDGMRVFLSRPALFVPFLIAGLVIVGVEQAMLADPVPVTTVQSVTGTGVDLQFPILPVEQRRVTTPLPALWGLKLRWLAQRALFAAVTTGTTALAGAVAVVGMYEGGLRPGLRALDGASAARAVGYVAGFGLALSPVVALVLVAPILVVPAFVLTLFVAVRLFVAFPLAVRGASIATAVRTSWRRMGGYGISLTLFLLLLGVFGLSRQFGFFGGGLATVLVGVPQVGTMAVLAYWTEPSDEGEEGTADAADA
ncbi:hypothetical protein [Halorientalis pallida]|uniref:Membrane domain of glycerophosphoryl diester phosphodiesterase n=1 Tax=Halorientalis pallida TaxID=2479928 RepID=A0A498L1F3_9EURY|nr:hypothetical protein [Halorientalis pallida]RXK49181.1 hypothetical protein EAF64_09680 [Halorientalis pallida]